MSKEENNGAQIIWLSEQEYASFMLEVNTLFFSRFTGHEVAYIAIGDYGYRFRIFEFGSYQILSRKELR